MMLSFQIYVKYADEVFDLRLYKPEDCSVISIINDVKKKMTRHHVQKGETWELSVTFPWNDNSHVISSDEELMIVFEEFDHRLKPVIEFDLNLFPLAAKIHENDVQLIPPMLECCGQFGIPNSGPHAASFSEPDIPISGQPVVNDEESDSDVDNDYDVNEDADSDVSLDVDCGKVDDDRHDRCDLNGDDTWLLQSSDEETEVIKMAKYCRQHQWAPNPDGSIEISEGQILGNAKVARDVLKRAKKIVLNNMKSGHIAAYAKMKKYGNAIIAMNPGTCVKTGFKKGVRPLIGIDGYHLSRQFGGVMLSANALDRDSGIFPIAFCVCESETFESWTWFLKLLSKCLGWDDSKPICYMSDRQKGELKALDNEWPHVGKRYCFRHMLGNFKSTFKDNKMNGKLWSITRAGSKSKFRERIKSLGEDSMEAVSCLMKEPCEKWARHAFDCDIKLDHITNNMSEYFNNWIKDERDKPILTLLEHLRKKVMVRFSDKCDELEKLQDSITPYARQTLTRNEKKGRKLQVYHGMGDWYETINKKGRKMLVNIGEVTCDCGMWQISGLPCKHDVTVFMYNREFPHDHVHWYYTKEAVKLTYNGAINPIPDESRWHEYHSEHIDPPAKRTKVGRPKKIRKRAPDESRAPSKTFSNRCQTCKNIGHNSRICKDKVKGVGSSSKEKKTSKRSVVAPTFGTQEANQTGNGGSIDTTFQQSMAPLTSASQQYSTAISARNQEGISTESEQHMAAPTNVPDGCSQIGSLSQP
ncbi:hypothetical protein QYF36_005672 [Acer negundo]|nr:hypothetical protein QYF36_005672 [Acer negundo]